MYKVKIGRYTFKGTEEDRQVLLKRFDLSLVEYNRIGEHYTIRADCLCRTHVCVTDCPLFKEKLMCLDLPSKIVGKQVPISFGSGTMTWTESHDDEARAAIQEIRDFILAIKEEAE